MVDEIDELKRREMERLFKFVNSEYTVLEPKSETTMRKGEDTNIKKAKLAKNLWIGFKGVASRVAEYFSGIVEKHNAEKREIDRKTIDKIVDVAAERLEMAKGLRPKVKTPEQMNYINAKLQEAGLRGVNIIDISLSELGIKTIPGINIERIKIPKKNIIGKFLMGKRLKNINIKDKEIDKLNKQIKLAKARGIENIADISNLLIYKEKLRELEKEKIALIKKVFIVKDAVMKSSNFKPSSVKPVSKNEPVAEGYQPIPEVNIKKAGTAEKKTEVDPNSITRDGDYIRYTDNQGRDYSDYQPEEEVIEKFQPITGERCDLEEELNNKFNPLPEVDKDNIERERGRGFAEEFMENHKLEQLDKTYDKSEEGVIILDPLENNNDLTSEEHQKLAEEAQSAYNQERHNEMQATLDAGFNNNDLTSEEHQKLAEEVQNAYDQARHNEMQAKYDSPEFKFELAQQDYKNLLYDSNANPKDIANQKAYMEGMATSMAGNNQELLEEILNKVNNIEKNVETLRKESLENHKDVLMTVAHSAQQKVTEPEFSSLKEGRQYIKEE
ncbi:MAG: hypothetical protein PHS45_01655 [Bacilli bacterium]|nr:hypothetical protein [Bacilli bacterium]